MTPFKQKTSKPKTQSFLGFPVSELGLEFLLSIEQGQGEEPTGWKYLRAEAELSIDGVLLEGKGSFELGSFLFSVLKYNCAIDLFTCSCGIAGCAGINEKALIHPLGADHLALILPAEDYLLPGVAQPHHIASDKAQDVIANFPGLLIAGTEAFYGPLPSESLLFVFERASVASLARAAKKFIAVQEKEHSCHAYPFHGQLFEAPLHSFQIQLTRSAKRHRERMYWDAYRKEVYGDWVGSYVYLKSEGQEGDEGDLFIANLPDFINTLARIQAKLPFQRFASLSETLKHSEKHLFAQVKLLGFKDFIAQQPSSLLKVLTDYYDEISLEKFPSLYISAPTLSWLASQAG